MTKKYPNIINKINLKKFYILSHNYILYTMYIRCTEYIYLHAYYLHYNCPTTSTHTIYDVWILKIIINHKTYLKMVNI